MAALLAGWAGPQSLSSITWRKWVLFCFSDFNVGISLRVPHLQAAIQGHSRNRKDPGPFHPVALPFWTPGFQEFRRYLENHLWGIFFLIKVSSIYTLMKVSQKRYVTTFTLIIETPTTPHCSHYPSVQEDARDPTCLLCATQYSP